MIYKKMKLSDVYLIELDKKVDDRGWFSRVYCEKEQKENIFPESIKQVNSSFSKQKGTLRGLHFQNEPFQESKIIKVLTGKIYDLILDLRPESSTYLQWEAFELSSETKEMLYVPKGFAHSILTLEDDTEILYFVSEFYQQNSESGIRWNDPYFNFHWPLKPSVVSGKDQNWPLFENNI
jgi:dTDP-4-dehydrorhamnose 3,5-epimerase